MRECRDAAPNGAALPRSGLFSPCGWPPDYARTSASSISAPNVHLPWIKLRCTIRDAYQAADAGLPEMGSASSPQSKQISPGSSVHTSLCAANAHIGKGIT
jgi:hypothetical protein